MDSEELKEILQKHNLWLHMLPKGERASLCGTNLTWVNLCRADLRRADLSHACLMDTNLSGANLHGADLSWADMFRANLHGAILRYTNLRGAHLQEANISEADLYGADLRWTDLRETNMDNAKLDQTVFKAKSAWDYCYNWPKRIVKNRTLVLGSRTTHSPYMCNAPYELGKCYVSKYFSNCGLTTCHPGLYIAGEPGKGNMLVAFWLDEAIIVRDKCRVPRFRTVRDISEFTRLRTHHLENGEVR